MSRDIINTYGQLEAAVAAGVIPKAKAVGVGYHAVPPGRMGYADSSHAYVFSPYFETDQKAHWADYGRKTFTAMGPGFKWREWVEVAKAWASKRYGIKEWKMNLLREWVPAEVQERFPIPRRVDTVSTKGGS